MIRCVREDKLRGGGLVLDNVATLPKFALAARRFFRIGFGHLLGLFRENSSSFLDRKFHEGEPVGKSERYRCLKGLFLGTHRVASLCDEPTTSLDELPMFDDARP